MAAFGFAGHVQKAVYESAVVHNSYDGKHVRPYDIILEGREVHEVIMGYRFHMTMIHLSPNTTSLIHPYAQIRIQSLKVAYRRCLVEWEYEYRK